MLPAPDLCSWAETTLYDIGRALLDYQTDAEDVSLFEARLAADTLDSIISELMAREAQQG